MFLRYTKLQTFCTSATVSINHPMPQRIIPSISRAVPKLGSEPPWEVSDIAGEFRIVKGRDTVQTYQGISIALLIRTF